MIFYHLVNDRNASNSKNTCVERFFRRLMGQKSVFYSEFSENNCNAVFSLESGFPFFETMNFDGSKSAGRSSSIIFPKALSKTRLNWLKYRYMRNVSKKIKYTLNQMPIISISLVVFNSVRLRSTSLKSGLDNRCRFLRTVSIPDSSFSAIVDC